MRNTITLEGFEKGKFVSALVKAANGDPKTPAAQVEYLGRYCELLSAQSFVHESHYVDRHYVDEFAFYYSRTLKTPSNSVHRFHVFSKQMTESEFFGKLEAAMLSQDKRREIQGELSGAYLGFITVRPIASVPVGRTVLKRVADTPGAHRDIWATNTHDVHLANLNLRVEGLAFQQQDIAVGACATAALWSALSRVARHEGMRAPTPAEVSEAAARHILPNGRSIPASGGLTMEQLSDAIRACGFAPEAFRATPMPEFFAIALHAYLLSGIPVVLALRQPGVGHAVTAVGFQLSNTINPHLQSSVPVRSARLHKIYVHDDRLGPYAKSFISPLPGHYKQQADGLIFEIEKEKWVLDSALVPVYPKLRLSVRALLSIAESSGGLIEQIVGPKDALTLAVEVFYKRSGDYLSDLTGRVSPAGSAEFLRSVALSRWCAVIRWYVGEQQVMEFVYDTTDILRQKELLGGDLLRAVICLDPRFGSDLQVLGKTLSVPTLA
jgi:hypothetical protein